MKIGIDAKWFFTGPPSGKVVLKNLLKELLVPKYEHHKFYIFLNKGEEGMLFPFMLNNVHLVYVHNWNNLLANAFVLPFYQRKLNLDTVLFQNFGSFFPPKKGVVYIHDLLFLDFPQFFSLKERVYLRAIKPLAKNAKQVATISASEKSRVLRHQLAHEEDVYFVHHGISSRFKPLTEKVSEDIARVRQKYGLPKKYVLFLGRLNVRKNIKNLLLAMKDIDCTLVIAGESSHKTDNLSAIIEQNNLMEKVVFTGHVDDEDLPMVYAMAKVFCFPSYAEGFGLPPLEAMSSGVPVVSSDRTSLKEVCGTGALFIDPDRPAEITEKINILLNSPSKRMEMIEKGLEWVKKFSWERSAKQLMDIIENQK
ncbi:MAG: glycosyltransferase family 1 protein [Bacteroidota bacterium]